MATRSRIDSPLPHASDATLSRTSNSPPTRDLSASTLHPQQEHGGEGRTEDTFSETVDDLAVRLLGLALVLGALAFAFLEWVVVLL